MEYEYGIISNQTGDVHRDGMTREQASEWIREWIEMGGKSNAFGIIARPIGSWAVVELTEV